MEALRICIVVDHGGDQGEEAECLKGYAYDLSLQVQQVQEGNSTVRPASVEFHKSHTVMIMAIP